MRRLRTIALLLSALVLGACGGSPASRREAARPVASLPADLAPLAVPLRVVARTGSIEAKIGSATVWSRVDGPVVPAGATALRAGGRGAVFEVADAGKLWLRGGASVRIGEHRGRVLAAALEGEARLSIFGERRDVLLSSAGEAEVAADPERAGWAPAIEVEAPDAGVGSLEARGPDGRMRRLALRRLHVEVGMAGDLAETRVEHVFWNDSDEQMEGTFRFPLPDGALLVGMAMEVNGKMVEGELVEREKARQVYEKIVDAMRDPALLEWEEGSRFKLRVFPIEPHKEKKVVLTYLAPLHEGAAGPELVYPTAAPEREETIGRFRLDLEGTTIVDDEGFEPGRDIVVPIGRPLAAALSEKNAQGTFLAVRLRPAWQAAARRGPAGPQRLVLVIDTSRSALESRALAAGAIRAALGEVAVAEVRALACDVDCREVGSGWRPVSARTIDELAQAIAAADFDGATDLGGALRRAGELARDGGADILYLGDGTPTWGETDAAALEAIAVSAAGQGAIHALALGKGGSTELLGRLAGATGGRAAHPRSLADVGRFAVFLAHARELARLRKVTVTAGEGTDVFPRGETTLHQGDELLALVRVPPDGRVPDAVTLRGVADDGRTVETKVALPQAAAAPHVARRWAARRIAALEAEGGHDPEVVELSLKFQVMSKQTSFLVLESEEMYREFEIARAEKQKAERADDPTVSGADLETVAAREASVSPDQIQPGDPEIRIPGREDARQVVVVFPFGETKVATWEPELRAWTVRFLIDAATRDGTYTVLVRITHRDGGVEELRMPYTVDTAAPTVRISMRRGERAGTFVVRADQDPATLRADGGRDLTRVEVVFPDGRSLRLDSREGGTWFEDVWTPRQAVRGPVRLRVVATDRALNQSVSEVTVGGSLEIE